MLHEAIEGLPAETFGEFFRSDRFITVVKKSRKGLHYRYVGSGNVSWYTGTVYQLFNMKYQEKLLFLTAFLNWSSWKTL